MQAVIVPRACLDFIVALRGLRYLQGCVHLATTVLQDSILLRHQGLHVQEDITVQLAPWSLVNVKMASMLKKQLMALKNVKNAKLGFSVTSGNSKKLPTIYLAIMSALSLVQLVITVVKEQSHSINIHVQLARTAIELTYGTKVNVPLVHQVTTV